MLELIKSLIQIAFWLVAGGIAVLSYLHARSSIFQPAKNEVFKVQVQDLKKLLEDINWKSDLDAWNCSGLRESSFITTNKIFKEYAEERFSVKIRSKDEIESVGGIISESADVLREIKGPADEKIDSENEAEWRERKHIWEEFCWEIFEIGPTLHKTHEIISEAKSNPVLPTAIIEKINALNDEIHQACVRAAEDIERIVREFPRHYPTKDSLQGADLTWVNNMKVERGQSLFTAYNALKQEIRDYLQTDKLFGLT